MSFTLVEKVYAQAAGGVGTPAATESVLTAQKLLQKIVDNIVEPLIVLMLAVAVIYFLWGVFQFVRNAESPEERKKGGTHMMYGVIGLFIMVSAYGIINVLLNTIR